MRSQNAKWKGTVSFWGTLVCFTSSYMIRQCSGVTVAPISGEEKGKIREQREDILCKTHARDTSLLPSCLGAVTIGVGGHEAGNFSVVRCESIPNHITFAGSISAQRGHSTIYSILFLALGANSTWCNRSIMAEQHKALSWSWWPYLCSIHRREALRNVMGRVMSSLYNFDVNVQ